MENEICYNEIVVCLFDGEYHIGVAALANSLAKFQFKGLINAGYRGPLPDWVNQLEIIGDNCYYLTKEIVIHFKQVNTEMHLGYFKPYFLKETIETYTSTQKFYYFDADIVVNSPWSLYSKWLEKETCLCLDCAFHFLHHNHPWRKDWKQLADVDEKYFNNTHYYFNSGFIGVERGSVALIHRWVYFTEKYIENGGNIKSFEKAPNLSFKGDQDLLNAAVTISSDIGISVMGKEAMGFTFPATIMIHAIGDIKPWNNSFFKQLIKSGRKPCNADQNFFSYCKYPINIFSSFNFGIKKIDLLLASFFGRIFG